MSENFTSSEENKNEQKRFIKNQEDYSKELKEDNINFFSSMIAVKEDTSKAKDLERKNLDPIHKKILAESKKVLDKPGSLYIAAETFAFNIPSRKFITVNYDEKDSKRFIKSFTQPYFIPVLYNHVTGTDPYYTMPQVPQAGRVVFAKVETGYYKTPSVFTGQVITEKDAIDRIMNMVDLTQSVHLTKKHYICSNCNSNTMSKKHLEECQLYPGDYIVIEKRGGEEYIRNTWSAIPDSAVEVSFTPYPAFPNARVGDYIMNSSGIETNESMFALVSYEKAVVGVGFAEDNDNFVKNDDKSNDIIKTQPNEGENINMSTENVENSKGTEDLASKIVESLSAKFSEISSKIESFEGAISFSDKVDNFSKEMEKLEKVIEFASKIEEISEKIGQIETLEKKIQSYEEEFSLLKNSVSEVTEKLSKIELSSQSENSEVKNKPGRFLKSRVF